MEKNRANEIHHFVASKHAAGIPDHREEGVLYGVPKEIEKADLMRKHYEARTDNSTLY